MRLLYRSSPPPHPASSSMDDSADEASDLPAFSTFPEASSSPGPASTNNFDLIEVMTHSWQRTASAAKPGVDDRRVMQPGSNQRMGLMDPLPASPESPGVLPGASYAAMQAAWLGTSSALPHMSLTRLLVMFFLERSVAGLSSAWHQLIWMTAFLLPLSTTTSFSLTSRRLDMASVNTMLPSNQARQGILRHAHSSAAHGEKLWASAEVPSALQDAPALQSVAEAVKPQADAWQEAASMVRVSLALGLQASMPQGRQPTRHAAEGRPWDDEQEREAMPALAKCSMTSMDSSLDTGSPGLSRTSSSDNSLADPAADSETLPGSSRSRSSSSSSLSKAMPDAESSAGPDAEPAAQAASTGASDAGTALHLESGPMPFLEPGGTKAAVPASSLEAWPGKGYFAVGRTLYLMPRAAEPQPDLSEVPDASQSADSAGNMASLCLLTAGRPFVSLDIPTRD